MREGSHIWNTVVQILEYCGPDWSPHYQRDVDKLERVQRRATKMMEGLGGMSYEDRLTELRLTTLETRRIRADLIEVFKIVHGGGNYCKRIGFIMDGGGRRGHGFKMFKKKI